MGRPAGLINCLKGCLTDNDLRHHIVSAHHVAYDFVDVESFDGNFDILPRPSQVCAVTYM